MDWIRSHPFASILLFAGTVLVIGTFVIKQRSDVPPVKGEIRAWTNTNASPLPGTQPSSYEQSTEPDIFQQIQNAPPYSYAMPSFPITFATPTPTQKADTISSLDELLAKITQKAHTVTNTVVDTAASSGVNPYSLIPQGMISMKQKTTSYTPEQQALYDYGNEIGSYLQAFEIEYSNGIQVVQDHANDRYNAQKAQALRGFGNGYVQLGKQIEALDVVPPVVSGTHAALAKSYQEMGTKLARIADNPKDDDFLKAIETYHTSVEANVRNYVALVSLFSASGVHFAPEDPGSVFTFTQTAGL